MPPLDHSFEETDLQETLVKEAWRLASEALHSGTLTLKNSKGPIKLSERDMLKHVQWLASLGKRKPKSFPLPKETFIKPTE